MVLGISHIQEALAVQSSSENLGNPGNFETELVFSRTQKLPGINLPGTKQKRAERQGKKSVIP